MSQHPPESRKPMTLTQKILAAHAIGLRRPFVQAGDILRIRVDWTLASELAWNGMEQTYEALGRPPLHNPERFFLAVDHTVDAVTLARDARTQRLVQLSRRFAQERGIRHFYDANQTILHTKFYRDLVLPGQVVLGADSHTTSHGGLGAFAIGLGGADVTAAMVLGESWIEVPEAIAVEYQGEPPFGITGKDIILQTLGSLGRNTVALERTVEYRGAATARFSTDMRFTIANMTAEFGGLNGIFEPDGVVAAWVAHRDPAYRQPMEAAHYHRADPDAPYVSRYVIQLDRLAPLVARPFSPDNVAEVSAHAGLALDGCFIGACTTTEEELVLAALVLEQALATGQQPVPSDKRLVVPGDLSIRDRLQRAGLWAIYERAGFRIGEPGCSMCLGIASEKAGRGEVWLSSQNRNYQNRMGEGSLAWLASAPTVAASALGMRLTDPRPLLERVDRQRYERLLDRSPQGRVPEVQFEEPAITYTNSARAVAAAEVSPAARVLRGRVQRFGDHVDTDAIIPGPFCHLTDVQQLGDHCFALVRPGFAERARQGYNIIVAGEGWGSGSSREQAVWALRGAGVQCVVARSYAFIHKRNLVNEALPHLVLRDPQFYELCQEGDELEVDLSGQVLHVPSGRRFSAEATTPLLQALQAAGGLVSAIRRFGPEVFDALTAPGGHLP
ncbi:MAG: aconitase family protein [Myxococcales bacterium]|nr:aconitase family protein [Myxococcota bacterium]MDW8281874.1 aconitase family protein [Myxococcales bacterium]